MGGLGRAVDIEFFFEQSIHGVIKGKWETRRPFDIFDYIQPKTPWALQKQLNFGSA
jgi:hypothetical protein